MRFPLLICTLFLFLTGNEVLPFQEPVSFMSPVAEHISNKSFNPATLMWYASPASQWEEALPVGNGRLGAMVFGGVEEERIQLNEDTYWSGGPYNTVVEGGHEVLPDVQKLIFDGKPLEAHKLFGRHLMGYPVEQQKYQALANLHLFFEKEAEPESYMRWLDLSTGVTGVEYTRDSIIFLREVFASAVDQVIAIRLTASESGQISFDMELRGVRNSAHSNYATDYFRMDGEGNHELILTGKSADYLGIAGQLRYEARLRVAAEGGTVTRKGTRIQVSKASTVTLYFVAATNFISYQDVSGDEKQRVQAVFDTLEKSDYQTIRGKAITDYQGLFDRVSLTLPTTQNSYLPTNKRLQRIQSTSDPQMAALSYQFGRYLLISSSRPGTQPTNLQGIWNKDMNPSWDSKYTTNINTEMNYWPAEPANLAELTQPLFQMIEELTDQGAQVAREHYGAGGWVFHQNTDIWRVAAPMDGPTWGTFTVGGAWLTTHLWEHFLYSRDTAFLDRVYPIIKGSVDFFMDFLVEHPNGKWLITNPSNSPENPPDGPGYTYFYDEVTGMYYFTTIVAGSTMDMQILKDLFACYSGATQLLDRDGPYALEVAKARERLVPSLIGKDGSLQEWTEDYGQLEDKHRHFSHLYGLYPGNVLSARATPGLVDPIKAVLEQRGDGGTGFSRAWKMALWARLYDGDRAHAIYTGYLKEQCYASLFAKCYTPMQVDGALGVTAAISEMLLQSHEGSLQPLPALPLAWPSGEFHGVCARGAFELGLVWEQGAMKTLEILSRAGAMCRIRTDRPVDVFAQGKPVPHTKRDGYVEFPTVAGQRYHVEYDPGKGR